VDRCDHTSDDSGASSQADVGTSSVVPEAQDGEALYVDVGSDAYV
jgi:hypothetical protein